jgi:pimeloyl-ACP methyl ester carboxylesterase
MKHEVRFAAADLELAGELSVRDDTGGSPALVFLHGSGPATRGDWEQETAYLVEAGVATLAYDKPGCGGSAGDWTAQSFDDRAAEALAALRFVRRDPKVDRSWAGLFGASQGGWIAPMAAASSDEVSFVIAASASGVSPREQDRFRVEHGLRSAGLDAREAEDALATWEERDRRLRRGEAAAAILEAERRVQGQRWYSILDFDEPGVLDFVGRVWDFDPAPQLERCRCPILAIWGADDTIVPVERSRAIFAEALGARAELVVLPGADHQLRVEQDAAWGSAALPFIADWIRSRGAGASG